MEAQIVKLSYDPELEILALEPSGRAKGNLTILTEFTQQDRAPTNITVKFQIGNFKDKPVSILNIQAILYFYEMNC